MRTADDPTSPRAAALGAPSRVVGPGSPSLPDAATLLGLVRAGWSFERIHEHCERQAGAALTESSLVLALSDVVLRSTAAQRDYWDHLPWATLEVHRGATALQLLRLLGRSGLGAPLPFRLDARLGAWRARLRAEHLIVAYVPSTDEGFWYVEKSLRNGPRADLPLRVQPLRWAPDGARADLGPDFPP